MADLIQASDQSSKLRIVPHYGDVAMILQLVRSKIWRDRQRQTERGVEQRGAVNPRGH